MPAKVIKTIKALKTRIKKTLPEKISRVLESYENFLAQEVPDDAKGFTAYHSACKSAVVHAETLLKLSRWTDEEAGKNAETTSPRGEILRLLEQARLEDEEFGDD